MFNLPMTLLEQNYTKKQPVGVTESVCIDAEGGWGDTMGWYPLQHHHPAAITQ